MPIMRYGLGWSLCFSISFEWNYYQILPCHSTEIFANASNLQIKNISTKDLLETTSWSGFWLSKAYESQ